jgi:hypothetical protein
VTVFSARARQVARWVLAGALAVGTITAVCLAYVFVRRRDWDRTQDELDRRLLEHGRKVSIANARAAVEIAAVRAAAGDERDRLLAALAIRDEDPQIDQLIELGRKVRGE